MSPEASELASAVGLALGAELDAGRSVSGGSINAAYRFERIDDGEPVFVKTSAKAAAGEFDTEAASLDWLSERGDVRTPSVLAVGAESPRFLALEWIEPGRLSPAGEEDLGRGLAAMHGRGASAHGAPPPGPPGAVQRLGSLELRLEPSDDWNVVYVEQRILPLLARARDEGKLGRSGAEAIEQVCQRIDGLAGPPEPPSRLHGDLWSGNVHADCDGNAWLIDPTAHGGHRELDLAMLELFGPRLPRMLAAYNEVSPLADGYDQRVALWQLQPLLVHAVLFGGHYGAAAEQAAATYLS